MLTKIDVMSRLLPSFKDVKASNIHFSPSNIALCKYWGKRDAELNLPINPSLSVSLKDLGTQTRVIPVDQLTDDIWLNGSQMQLESQFAKRITAFMDLFRQGHKQSFRVETHNNIPTAAGLASSASGFAALTFAMDDALSLNLESEMLSMIARMGSGSACRSIYQGFVEWRMGEREDGLDSHAHKIEARWPSLSIGLVKVDVSEKSVDSRSGMQRTIASSSLYKSWPDQAHADLKKLHQAIDSFDFTLLGSTAEHNAMSMHATFASSWPPLLYWQPESVEAMHKVWQLRQQGIEVYFTMDAGPNLKLIFEHHTLPELLVHFPELEVVQPFCE